MDGEALMEEGGEKEKKKEEEINKDGGEGK